MSPFIASHQMDTISSRSEGTPSWIVKGGMFDIVAVRTLNRKGNEKMRIGSEVVFRRKEEGRVAF